MPLNSDSSLKNVATKYVQTTKLKVTTTSVCKRIEESPWYPSLRSLSDTFDILGIPNAAFEVAAEDLSSLPLPFIAYASLPGVANDFILVTRQTPATITYYHKNRRAQTISTADFKTKFKNIVWLTTPDEHSEEPSYTQKIKSQRTKKNKRLALYTLIAAVLVMTYAVNTPRSNELAFFSIVLLKLAGVAATTMILIYEIDKHDPVVALFCTSGSGFNCDAVLNSNPSKIMGTLGFYYFSATSLFLLFPTVSYAEKVGCLAVANALASLFMPFSIYFQWKIIKQWCRLCLIVQGTLILELLWSIKNFRISKALFAHQFPTAILPITISLLAPIAIRTLLIQILTKVKNARQFEVSYKRLQQDPAIFRGLLFQQPKVPDGWQTLGIDLGNPHGETTVIKICNPYCLPCAKIHPELEELLARKSNVRLKIIFSANNAEQDPDATVAKHLLTIAAAGDKARTQRSLDHWYLDPEKRYETFAEKYPVQTALASQAEHLEAMRLWCKYAEIAYTPAIFINGHRLPENYTIEELKYML